MSVKRRPDVVTLIDECAVTPSDFNRKRQNDQKIDSIRSDTHNIVLNSLIDKIEFSFFLKNDFFCQIFFGGISSLRFPYFKLLIYLLTSFFIRLKGGPIIGHCGKRIHFLT
jgi:hypothetical protein